MRRTYFRVAERPAPTTRFIPLSGPWRNGVVEHFNGTRDKPFLRAETFTGLDHVRSKNHHIIAFHNVHHR